MLSENSFLTVINAIRELISNGINTIREESWRKFSKSKFWNGLHSKKVQIPAGHIFIEIRVDCLFEGFLGPNFIKNLKFKNNLRTTLKTLPQQFMEFKNWWPPWG